MAGKVIVLGGGVAGLSAAHGLVERGFTVEVFARGTDSHLTPLLHSRVQGG